MRHYSLFSSPLGDGLVPYVNDEQSAVERFSSPLGDGLVPRRFYRRRK